jgi:hypothetical protein
LDGLHKEYLQRRDPRNLLGLERNLLGTDRRPAAVKIRITVTAGRVREAHPALDPIIYTKIIVRDRIVAYHILQGDIWLREDDWP